MTEVSALDRLFDYAVTTTTQAVQIGDRVRVNLNGRSIRGWVWEFVETDRELKSLTKWLGLGIPPSMRELIEWSAHRWCGSAARFLLAASPQRLVTTLPLRPLSEPLGDDVARGATPFSPGVIRLAPTVDPIGLVLHAYEETRERDGSLLVLVPNEGWARRLGGRLAQRGCAVAFGGEWDRMRAGWPVIVGARGVAFAPTPAVRGAVIIDADDEAFRSEAAPTWHAFDVVRERCAQFNAPWWSTSPLPSPRLCFAVPTVSVSDDEAANWPTVEVVDLRATDPHDGVLSTATLIAARRALETNEPVAVAVVLQRLGSGRLFACRNCGELARCKECGAAEIEVEGWLSCPVHPARRELFCQQCGSTKLRRVRSGVTTLARDVGAQLATAVSEITATSPLDTPMERVVVGTEALWRRIRRCSLVVFVDFDQYLLAPRERARRDAILAVAKAGRLVGPRHEGRGRVVLQTRRGNDQVLTALMTVNFDELTADDEEVARLLELPPYGAVAEISGESAELFVAGLANSPVLVTAKENGFVVRANSIELLTDSLAAVSRPTGRLRIAVD